MWESGQKKSSFSRLKLKDKANVVSVVLEVQTVGNKIRPKGGLCLRRGFFERRFFRLFWLFKRLLLNPLFLVNIKPDKKPDVKA